MADTTKTVRYLVVRVEIEHEKDADPDVICLSAEVIADEQDGTIRKSEILDITDRKPD